MLSNLISHYRLITNDNSTLLYILCSRFLRKNISTNLRALRGFPNRVCDEIATSDRTLFWTVLARRSPIACIYIDSKIYRIRLQTSEKIPKVQIVTRLLWMSGRALNLVRVKKYNIYILWSRSIIQTNHPKIVPDQNSTKLGHRHYQLTSVVEEDCAKQPSVPVSVLSTP